MTSGIKDTLETQQPICPECGGIVRPVKSNTSFKAYDKLYKRNFGDGNGFHDTAISRTAQACIDCGLEVANREINWDTENLRAECYNRLKNRIERHEFIRYKKVLNRMIYQENVAFKLKGFTFDVAVEKVIEKVVADVKHGVNYQNMSKWERKYLDTVYFVLYEANGFISLDDLLRRIKQKYIENGSRGTNLPTRKEMTRKFMFRLPVEKTADSHTIFYRLKRADK